MIGHASRKHALLSASGAARWMNCTPSARLEEHVEERGSSDFAAEGTLAHEFGDWLLKHHNGEVTKRKLNAELKKLRKHRLYTDEMEEEVDKYVTYVIETFKSAKKGAELMVERRLDFSHIVPDGFGTGDTTIAADDTLEVIDLKYGKGIKVDAPENPQLMLYGLGALRMVDLMYDIETVRLTIVQPRLNHISTWEISAADLITWGEEQVKPKADMAFNGEGTQKAGSWCKWCRVKATCTAIAKQNLALARFEFKEPALLSEDEVLEVYEQQEQLVDWAKAVSEYVQEEAMKGKKWPGYKLVEGRSNRKWRDEDAAIKVLAEKYKREDYMQEKLKGIVAVSKLVGDDIDLNPLMIKPPGKPTLAPDTDERPPINSAESAKEDFS